MTTPNEEFYKLTEQQRYELLDTRLGVHIDRVSSLDDLFNLKGSEVYLVFSPNTTKGQIGNSFMKLWVIGDIIDYHGNIVDNTKEIDKSSEIHYLCYDEIDDDLCFGLTDFNVLPNNYNNNAVFKSKEGAEMYIMYRKLKYDSEDQYDRIEKDYDIFINPVDIMMKNNNNE